MPVTAEATDLRAATQASREAQAALNVALGTLLQSHRTGTQSYAVLHPRLWAVAIALIAVEDTNARIADALCFDRASLVAGAVAGDLLPPVIDHVE